MDITLVCRVAYEDNLDVLVQQFRAAIPGETDLPKGITTDNWNIFPNYFSYGADIHTWLGLKKHLPGDISKD